MQLEFVTNIISGRQDGAIFGGYLFSFDHLGACVVYKTDALETPIAQFTLDKTDIFMPHCNAVAFGTEYMEEEDEFPLLYANIYNNYAKEPNPMKGTCGVYRITKEGDTFRGNFVQIIEIGFTENTELWKSETVEDARPYGNFVVDRDQNQLFAFTMRDETKTTRYFAFDLPKASDGTFDETFGVNKVTLTPDDIKTYFDCEYHMFIQGACCHKEKIYSVEGFNEGVNIPPAIRVIDIRQQKQIFFKPFSAFGMDTEPELIDFDEDTCYYADNGGNVYRLTF